MQRMRVTAVVVALAGAVALTGALSSSGASAPARASGAFAWLPRASPPAGWNLARTHGGAALAYPPGWTPIKTDRGTASVALLGAGQGIAGYLNVTPRQGPETLADWSRFRPQHNHGEGDRSVRLVAATTNGRFLSGRGACVI